MRRRAVARGSRGRRLFITKRRFECRRARFLAFRDAFATLGYVICDHEQLEPGYEKVALFTLAGKPKHAARQLNNGRWTSKLGPMEDIEHALHDLTGMVYGSVVMILKRPLAPVEGETPARESRPSS